MGKRLWILSIITHERAYLPCCHCRSGCYALGLVFFTQENFGIAFHGSESGEFRVFCEKGLLACLAIHEDQGDVPSRTLTDVSRQLLSQGVVRHAGDNCLNGGVRLLINGQHEAATTGRREGEFRR